METEWLLDEIATGLQKLLLLSLDRAPAAENIAGTALAWLEGLTSDRDWSEARDVQRVRAAFVVLARTREAWPAPRHFMDALPPPSAQLRLPGAGDRPLDPPELLAALEATKRGDPLPDVPANAATRLEGAMSRSDMDRIERELVDRKRAAAGDVEDTRTAP